MNISFTPLRGSICWWRNCEGAAHETREFLVCNGGSWRCPRVYGRDGRQLALFFQDVGVAWLGPRDAVNAGPKFHGKLGRVHAKGLNMIPSRHGTKRSAVSTHCTIPAGAAGQRQHTQCSDTLRYSMPSFTLPNRAASGGGCPAGLAIGIPSTPG